MFPLNFVNPIKDVCDVFIFKLSGYVRIKMALFISDNINAKTNLLSKAIEGQYFILFLVTAGLLFIRSWKLGLQS